MEQSGTFLPECPQSASCPVQLPSLYCSDWRRIMLSRSGERPASSISAASCMHCFLVGLFWVLTAGGEGQGGGRGRCGQEYNAVKHGMGDGCSKADKLVPLNAGHTALQAHRWQSHQPGGQRRG